MALMTRISRLFHADINAVLDQIEQPELLLQQAIREMEEMLGRDALQIKFLTHQQQQLSNKEDEFTLSLTELDHQLALCFESNKDELARSLIKKKLEISQNLKILANKISLLEQDITQLSNQLRDHQNQLESMRQKAEIFARDNNINTNNSNWNNPCLTISDEDIDIAFLHEKQKWSIS